MENNKPLERIVAIIAKAGFRDPVDEKKRGYIKYYSLKNINPKAIDTLDEVRGGHVTFREVYTIDKLFESKEELLASL